MALLSQLDKVKIATEISSQLQDMDIENSGTLTVEVDLTAGQTSETTITDNSFTVEVNQI